MEATLTTVYEVRLIPKSKTAIIQFIDVRVDPYPILLDEVQVMEFLEKEFPMYEIENVIKGYRRLI